MHIPKILARLGVHQRGLAETAESSPPAKAPQKMLWMIVRMDENGHKCLHRRADRIPTEEEALKRLKQFQQEDSHKSCYEACGYPDGGRFRFMLVNNIHE